MSPSSQHPQHAQQPLPEVYTPAITAASCVARIFKDLLARGQIRFLGAIVTWYVGVALVALLSTQRLENLVKSGVEDVRVLRLALNELASRWPTAMIFVRGFERLKAFEFLDGPNGPSAPDAPRTLRGGNPSMPTTGAAADIANEAIVSPGLSSSHWMHGTDGRSYFPFISAQSSSLIGEIIATENQLENFLGDDFWYDDPSLALQDIFSSADALDPLLMESGLPF